MAKLKTEGTLLQVENATTAGTYDTVGQRLSIAPPELEADDIEETDLDSADVKDYRPSTLKEPGEATLTIYWDPENTGHLRLESLFWAGTKVNWRIVYNSGDSTRPHDEFNGYVKRWAPQEADATSPDDLKAEVVIKCCSRPQRGTTTIA